MRLASAAFGLAAVGAGLLVARMVMSRKGGVEDGHPPGPAQLIGYSPAHKSAEESAKVLREDDRQRPV